MCQLNLIGIAMKSDREKIQQFLVEYKKAFGGKGFAYRVIFADGTAYKSMDYDRLVKRRKSK